MKSEKIVLWVIIGFLLVSIEGCGKAGEEKYVGKYFRQDNFENILRIKKDGTYELKEKAPFLGQTVTTGEWRLVEGEIVLYRGRSRIPFCVYRQEGNTLVDNISGTVWVKEGK